MTINYEDMEEESKQIARCECCGDGIYDNDTETYLDAQGNYFCSLECCHEYYGIKKSEDCLGENE